MNKRLLAACVPESPEAREIRDRLHAAVTAGVVQEGAVLIEQGIGYLSDGQVTRGDEEEDGEAVLTLVFETGDPVITEGLIYHFAHRAGLHGAFEVAPLADQSPIDPDAPSDKSMEVYYDIASIPEGFDHPLDFRNAAMELMETALEAADAGEWEGAESGQGEINFGFAVTDFDTAEAIMRKAVDGTPFANIREITRYDSLRGHLPT